MEKYYLTKKGLDNIRKEYKHLKELKEKNAGNEMSGSDIEAELASFEEEDYIDARLKELELILNNYEIITPPPEKERDKVNLGATVVISRDKERDKFFIAGTVEANPSKEIISTVSPLGRALMGKKTGDKIKIGGEGEEYKIEEIRYL